MIKKAWQGIGEMVSAAMASNRSFDPASFNDPVARMTEWGPMKGGGANFRTYSLVKTSQDRLEFKASAGSKIFYSLFVVVGVGLLAGTLVFRKMAPVTPSLDTFIGTLLPGAVFTILGAILLRKGLAPIVFDQKLKAYWKGRVSPDHLFNPGELKHYAPFDKIHAVQIIAEHIRQKNSSYYSYELNLVLGDGSRLNVIDHGNIRQIRADAEQVAGFIGSKPVWDASGAF